MSYATKPTSLRVFHPSDFSDASHIAFIHALKLALESTGKLTIQHTGDGDRARDWSHFPHVRSTLERWEKLPPGSSLKAMEELGLEVVKVVSKDSDVEHGILRYLKNHPHDMLVLATHQYDGLERLRHQTIAEPLARHARAMTLFVPKDTDGFVSLESGAVNLRNILIPLDRDPDPQAAVNGAMALAHALSLPEARFITLYVGAESEYPAVERKWLPHWEWHNVRKAGAVEPEILQAAHDHHADLIVMATAGHHGVMDALRGSTTERIVRNAKCPVLAVPAARPEPLTATEPIGLLPAIS